MRTYRDNPDRNGMPGKAGGQGRGFRGWQTQRRRSGMTLMELTVYMAVTLMLAAALLMMLRSHFTFMRMLTAMEFLRDEAPQVNVMLTGILSKADTYRIYGSTVDAKAATNAVNTGGTAVRLGFRNPDGSLSEGIVDFNVVGGKPQLGYYNFNDAWPATPDWLISQRTVAVTFADDTGILLVTLTGPYGEKVTYAGTGE